MSIIYSYPEQGVLNADDMLIGTSAEKVSGKQKNITRNFSIQQIADFINGGTGFIDPVATDFQIPVFNQSGTKITGSIMSQDIYPNGTGITISGSLATTGSISTPGNLTATGIITLGSNQNLISLNSQTRLNGPILDTTGTVGSLNQILLSDSTGVVRWQNYVAGLTYQGVWNANTNTPALTSGVGTNGHFYVVDVLGNTNLNGNNDWQVGDWALFSGVTGAGGFWDKIDNTQSLTGSGTANTITMWTAGQAIGDSLISQAGTVVSVDGDLKVKDTIQATTANTNLKLKGAGTGGIEIMSADGITDGKIQLNCSVNSHGVTLQSPAHGSTVSYTLILPTSFGGAGDVLTSQGTNPSQLVWTTPTTGTVTGTGTTNTLPIWTNGGAGELGDSILDQLSAAGVFTDTHLSVAGSGGLSTQNLEINKALYDGAASSGSDGFVLTSATSGTDKIISWVDPTTIGDSYDLRTTTVGGNVELSLVSGSATDNSAVIVTGAGGITVTETQGANPTDPTTLTLTGTPGGVTSVGTADADLITIAGTGSGPYTGAVTATANTSAVTSISTNLATGSQIQTAIDTALAGTLTFKGTFNAATGAISSPGSGQLYTGSTGGIAITKGDFYIADTAGSFYGTTAMNVGDEAIALNTVAAAPPGSTLSDWSVVPAQSSGGTVTGTGAATQVTFWDGTSNVNGDTAFNWDNTNKRLGIGTATPLSELHAKGGTISTPSNVSDFITNATARLVVNHPNEYGAYVGYLNSANDAIGIQSARSNASIGPLSLNPYGGNVGIGTSIPNRKLQVAGSFAITDSSDTSSVLIIPSTSVNNIYSRASQGANSSTPLAVRMDTSEVFRITSTGGISFGSSGTAYGAAGEVLTSTGNTPPTWQAAGGGASTITTNNSSGNGTVGPFALGATPSGGSTSFVDVFIDGVYQEIATYTVSGTALSFAVGSEPPTGTNIQTKTTSGTVSGALVSSVDIGQSSGDVGAVNLRINPIEVPSGTTPAGAANSLYIFTSTTGSISTLNLPASPTAGDSIKISNIGGLANVIATSGTDKIMGQAGPMTIDVTNAAFEMIWSNIAAQGWIIIGNV